MTHTQKATLVLLMGFAASCRNCQKPVAGATTGSGAPPQVPAPALDAGPAAPYERVERKLPPLPAQANLEHIFIGFDRGSAPWVMPPAAKKRTLAEARSLAERIVSEARRGVDFNALGKKESDWPLADRNGASFGVLTAGSASMLAAFDANIFKLKVGEVSDPLESGMGFHILKRIPGLRVAHIYLAVHDGHTGPPARTLEETKALADKIEQELKGGADFGAEALAQSDDPGSAGRSGDLGLLDARSAGNSQIYQAGQKLNVGAVSAPIAAPGGFEIVKRIE